MRVANQLLEEFCREGNDASVIATFDWSHAGRGDAVFFSIYCDRKRLLLKRNESVTALTGSDGICSAPV